jgi:hypothetical protein
MEGFGNIDVAGKIILKWNGSTYIANVDVIRLSRDTDKCRSLQNMERNFRIPQKERNSLARRETISLLRRSPLHGIRE